MEPEELDLITVRTQFYQIWLKVVFIQVTYFCFNVLSPKKCFTFKHRFTTNLKNIKLGSALEKMQKHYVKMSEHPGKRKHLCVCVCVCVCPLIMLQDLGSNPI